MTQYISKDTLVADIKERIETYNKGYANDDDSCYKYFNECVQCAIVSINGCGSIIEIIDKNLTPTKRINKKSKKNYKMRFMK